MGAQETIQAAITRLEELTSSASAGPWESGLRGVEGPGGYVAEDDGMEYADRMLIVLLHRTIDAQLAILRHGAAQMTPFAGMVPTDEIVHYELTLARAILGEVPHA